MALNLISNPSFESGLPPWQTAGSATVVASDAAFEGDMVAQLSTVPDPAAGDNIISQAVAVDPDIINLRLSYAIRGILFVQGNGIVEVRIRWQRGAADGYSVISEVTLETIEAFSLLLDTWATHVVVSGPKPADAVQARLRFILINNPVNVSPVQIDQVVLTQEFTP
ncbi:hypothetical protein [Paenibacillus humicola]|uniref:hypothetical protein n=1 Tax=Paenibacillus humicola TaxID=3110540 RepID=UPI00237A73DA|nr:hypothetical protein [Paenibacillus humicola]